VAAIHICQSVHHSYTHPFNTDLAATMRSIIYTLFVALASVEAAAVPPTYAKPEYTVHPIFRSPEKFENLVVRQNGQILATTVAPNASIYQIDPLGKLPAVIVHTISYSASAVGIAEKEPGLFYVASTYVNTTHPQTTVPSEYAVTELDLRHVDVLSNGKLTQQPRTKRVASLPHAALLNGIAFTRQGSDQLLVADSFRGLIWTVNVTTGAVGVSLNDTSTKGAEATGPGLTGVNGLKVYNKTMYWTVTGGSSFWKIDIDECGHPASNATPTLIATNITAGVDDFVVDHEGTAFICGPYNAITKVSAKGQPEIVAGTFNSTTSSLGGPTAVRFGKDTSDAHSLYVTTNGGIFTNVKDSQGVSRIDLTGWDSIN
jgi:hypothetical protein